MLISACNFMQLCFFWSLESLAKSKLNFSCTSHSCGYSLAKISSSGLSDIYNSCFLVSVQSFKGCCAITLRVLMCQV